jgi:hypothetical protein
MQDLIARILERYESGHLSRRDLIRALASLASAAPAATAAGSTFKGVGLNHLGGSSKRSTTTE